MRKILEPLFIQNPYVIDFEFSYFAWFLLTLILGSLLGVAVAGVAGAQTTAADCMLPFLDIAVILIYIDNTKLHTDIQIYLYPR